MTSALNALRLLTVAALLVPGVPPAFALEWGINGHPVTQAPYSGSDLDAQLERVAALGAGWYRVDVNASGFDAASKRFDELLDRATAKHIRLLPVLLAAPGARSDDQSPEQIRAAAFAFGQRMASRYKGRISHWELSNERDNVALARRGETLPGSLVPLLSPPDGQRREHYIEARYARARAEIEGLGAGIKAGDPDARTLVDANWLHLGFIERLVREDRVPFDILAWHWYSDMGDIRSARGVNVLAELAKYGKPLWLTELNRRDGSMAGREAAQADYLATTLASLARGGELQAIFVYELLDEPQLGASSGEAWYGLVGVDWQPGGRWSLTANKPAFEAVRTAIAASSTR